MADQNVIKLRLSLMGRPIRSYTFDKPVITIGRDPASDVFVDNPGVSRDHLKLERQSSGQYQIVDLGSANGTFLNDQTVHTAALSNNDVIRFGKYTLWIGYDTDRRLVGAGSRSSLSPESEQHTVVLSRTELGQLIEQSKAKDPEPSAEASMSSYPGPAAPAHASPTPVVAVVAAFVLGAAIGAGVTWYLLR